MVCCTVLVRIPQCTTTSIAVTCGFVPIRLQYLPGSYSQSIQNQNIIATHIILCCSALRCNFALSSEQYFFSHWCWTLNNSTLCLFLMRFRLTFSTQSVIACQNSNISWNTYLFIPSCADFWWVSRFLCHHECQNNDQTQKVRTWDNISDCLHDVILPFPHLRDMVGPVF